MTEREQLDNAFEMLERACERLHKDLRIQVGQLTHERDEALKLVHALQPGAQGKEAKIDYGWPALDCTAATRREDLWTVDHEVAEKANTLKDRWVTSDPGLERRLVEAEARLTNLDGLAKRLEQNIEATRAIIRHYHGGELTDDVAGVSWDVEAKQKGTDE